MESLVIFISCIASLLAAIFSGMTAFNQRFKPYPIAYVDKNNSIIVKNVCDSAILITSIEASFGSLVGMTGIGEYGTPEFMEPIKGNKAYIQYLINGHERACFNYAINGGVKFNAKVKRNKMLVGNEFKILLSPF